MKKTKVETRFEYTGLGFPVILLNVPMIEVRGIWTPNIDYNLLQKVVLFALANSPSALTGNHIRFIRSWFSSTQAEFGKLFGVTHSPYAGNLILPLDLSQAPTKKAVSLIAMAISFDIFSRICLSYIKIQHQIPCVR